MKMIIIMNWELMSQEKYVKRQEKILLTRAVMGVSVMTRIVSIRLINVGVSFWDGGDCERN